MASEDNLIGRIVKAIPSKAFGGKAFAKAGSIRLGVGDDSALISASSQTDWVLSCDAFVEGIHFLAAKHPADAVGYKSLVRAASDLAAMGATPRAFLLTLALPSDRTGAWMDRFLAGMGRAARSLGMRLIGGDTTKCPLISINITVIGEIGRGLAVTRAGARPGHRLYASGILGQAQLGLELIQRGKAGKYRRLLQTHLYPRIRVELGAWLAENCVASAMMDLSDGLSTDLARLCEASGVGAKVAEDDIPRVRIPRALAGEGLTLDPLQMALHGGEDYELLFTVPPNKVRRLRDAPGFAELTPIGEITRGRQVLLIRADGRAANLSPRGWDPFRKPASGG